MSRGFVVRKAAEIEIAEAVVWYEQRKPGLGRRFLDEVDRAFLAITERPEAWPLWYERRPYRKYVLQRFPFIVFFKLDPQNVVIVAVANTSRKPGYWLSRTQY